jgi:hypothetical protein
MIGTTVMTQNAKRKKKAKNANAFFSTISQKTEMEICAFGVITFESIKV